MREMKSYGRNLVLSRKDLRISNLQLILVLEGRRWLYLGKNHSFCLSFLNKKCSGVWPKRIYS
jgi:hypothetical protein